MIIETPLSICILNGYPKASRDNFDLAGVGHPHDFFSADSGDLHSGIGQSVLQ